MNRRLNILIVGGGIAGLAAASALSAAGHDVLVVEVDRDWRTAPTGLSLQPHTFRAFSRIGVAEDVARLGYTYSGTRLFRSDGTLIREVPGKPLEPGLPAGGGIMRPVLQGVMARRAEAFGARIALGRTFVGIDDRGEHVEVEFTDGSSGRFDLVVGADGIGSKVRSRVMPAGRQPFFTGQGSFRVVLSRHPDIDKLSIYLGPEVKAGITPASEDTMFMWLLSPEPNDDVLTEERQLARLMEVLRGLGGVPGEVRENLAPETDIIYRPLKAILVDNPWHVGRVVLIGDASHATTPHLASGASAAVEDGVVLAECIGASGTVGEALDLFASRRHDRCRFIVETSLRIGELELRGSSAEEQDQLYQAGIARLTGID